MCFYCRYISHCANDGTEDSISRKRWTKRTWSACCFRSASCRWSTFDWKVWRSLRACWFFLEMSAFTDPIALSRDFRDMIRVSSRWILISFRLGHIHVVQFGYFTLLSISFFPEEIFITVPLIDVSLSSFMIQFHFTNMRIIRCSYFTCARFVRVHGLAWKNFMISSKEVFKNLFDSCKRPAVPAKLRDIALMQVWKKKNERSRLCS